MSCPHELLRKRSQVTLGVLLLAAVAVGCTQSSRDLIQAYDSAGQPVAPSVSAAPLVQAAKVSRTNRTYGHSHGAGLPQGSTVPGEEEPNWPIIGGFLGALTLIVATAAITKPESPARAGGSGTF